MSLVELCKRGNLEGVKAALQRGADVNTRNEYGWTGLMLAVYYNHNSVVDLLLRTPNIDVNLRSEKEGNCALELALRQMNNEGLKLLLNVPDIDVNIVNEHSGWSFVHVAVQEINIEGLKLLLNHPGLTALTLNHKVPGFRLPDSGNTPVMLAVTTNGTQNFWDPLVWNHGYHIRDPLTRGIRRNQLEEQLEVLAADPRVDLDTTDEKGRSLEEAARWIFLLAFFPNS